MNRRITLNGVAYALGKTLSEVRRMVITGKLRAYVYGETGIEPYEKRDGSRHALIFVYERSLKEIVKPLPPPSRDAPTGELLLTVGAATFLGCTPHWIHNLAEKRIMPAYVYIDGANLELLKDQERTRGRVLHFRKSDLEQYKQRIEAYKNAPLTQRAKLDLSETQKEQIVLLARDQMKERGYVAMRPIRNTLALPSNTYDEALRRLRDEYRWPMKHIRVSEARAKRG